MVEIRRRPFLVDSNAFLVFSFSDTAGPPIATPCRDDQEWSSDPLGKTSYCKSTCICFDEDDGNGGIGQPLPRGTLKIQMWAINGLNVLSIRLPIAKFRIVTPNAIAFDFSVRSDDWKYNSGEIAA